MYLTMIPGLLCEQRCFCPAHAVRVAEARPGCWSRAEGRTLTVGEKGAGRPAAA